MPKTVTFDKNVTYNSVSYRGRRSVSYENTTEANPTVSAAKVGSETTRTSNTAGTLTMNAGHGFNTADTIDLFWSGGSRYNVTVGTVATNSVPISGGTGDNLPVNNAAITAMKRDSETRVVVGDDAVLILCSSPVKGYVHFMEADGTTHIATVKLSADDSGNQFNYTWDSGDGTTNPLAGGSIGKILFSHGTSSASQAMLATVLTN